MKTFSAKRVIVVALFAAWLTIGCTSDNVTPEEFGAEIADTFGLTLGKSVLFQRIYLVTFYDADAYALESQEQKALATEIATFVSQAHNKDVSSTSIVFSYENAKPSQEHHYVFSIDGDAVSFKHHVGPTGSTDPAQ